MASPSKPTSTVPVNPDPPSSPTAEAEVNAPGKFLPVLKWSESSFNNLMMSIQMPAAYGARYPQEGDTASDDPAGYVSLFADWFDICNLRLPLTIFMVELLEYDKIHISQLSPLGMVRVRNFEYIFRAQNVEPLLWILRMMLGGKLGRKARPVLREQNEDGLALEAPLWRMFCPDFEGKIEIVKCRPDEEGWNETILSNFRVPNEAALNALLPEGKASARENEKLLHLRQELNNLKAANAALVKEKTTAETTVKEAEARGAAALKEAEVRAAKELADANADRTKHNKVVEELQAELKTRESILGEVTSRATEAETRARQAEEVRDGLATSLAQVTNDHAWMRQHGIRHIVEAILDAPENATAVTDMNERVRQAGFKAGYDKCLNDVNPFFSSKFTDE
ncbi:hypothetical protein HanXRQr2_Chr04g0174341 [Helianthus annuus]|uniref:Transposase (Putative), gypsy type n=1 Tax=Helianthus annuus TaxID=4232 RepID=A0A9K3J8P2_HELAN|nr:hypothetical protein HanXRQr2_Chr04g0174341 [Helianthus annuus]KAJ0581591.1 hypothetical protein HanHA300_Chr04g0142761 [Helianthus annuus]KAJ0589587.1 hypothetical protein HanIR_Chr04g0187921 [Helianthus annuus]KAJ0597556.1 hypothetical protein HanHA89_Chr04g0155931 [Helianthus annuus]KAJ0758201.1 hypothetical protein HanLR1_Chr04g0147631 [Helianthus annuus]